MNNLPVYIVNNVKDFEPDHVFDCGQAFRWEKLSSDGREMYVGVAGGHVAAISYDDKSYTLTLANVTEEEYLSFWHHYLDLDTDYSSIKDSLALLDDNMKHAVAYGHGIRLLRQEFFETLISFIISANNNIPRIKKCIENLSVTFGNKIDVPEAFHQYVGIHKEYYAFPSWEALSSVTPEQISDACKAGYRCPYIVKSAENYGNALAGNVSLPVTEKEIMLYPGVGPKVADCVLLFTAQNRNVFPVDVWVRRVMSRLYNQEDSISGVHKYAHEHFGDLKGYAQQYLFYYIRSLEN